MADFYWPAAPCDGDEIRHGRRPAFRRPAQVERVLVFLPVQAADQQELPRVRGGEQRPAAVAGAFRAVPAGPAFEYCFCYCLVSADDRVLREGDAVVAGDDDDVGQAQRPERGAELPAPAVHLVGGGPRGADPGCHQAFRLRDGQFRLRGERQLLRDPRLLPPLRVCGPAVRHVHIEIGPGLPEGGDQGGEHPGHAVLHLARHAGMLRRDARGEFPFPQVSGLVERQARPGQVIGVIAQDFLRQPRQQPAELLPRPFMPAEQGLHPVRPLMPGLLGKFPAVRPRLPRQRPDVVHCRCDGPPLPHHPAQQVADQRVCSLAVLRGIFYAGHCGRGRVLFSHKIQERATAAPRCAPALPAAAARSRDGPLHQPHAGQSRNKQHASTQRETATVIPTSATSSTVAKGQ